MPGCGQNSDLEKKEVVRPVKFIIYKRDLDVARRNFEVAKAGVQSARKAFDDTRLVAPFAGLVSKTLVENFQNTQAKQPIMILQDDSSLEMVVDIPQRDYARTS